jgi:ParB-like chromosome segregation protein Spo0J
VTENINIEAITVGDRLRGVSDAKAAQLAESIESIGLRHPVWCVRRSGGVIELVSGAHRLAAFRRLGKATIPVMFDAGDLSDDELRLREIDENLHRSELTALEVGQHLAERERIETVLGLRARRGDNRHSRPAESAGLEKTVADIADELGVSASTVRARKRHAAAIDDDVAAELVAMNVNGVSGIADSPGQLAALADMSHVKQREVVERIKLGEKVKLRRQPKPKESEQFKPCAVVALVLSFLVTVHNTHYNTDDSLIMNAIKAIQDGQHLASLPKCQCEDCEEERRTRK